MKLSIAGWSLHKLFWAKEDALKLVDFPSLARDQFDLDAIEINNLFFDSTRPSQLDKLRSAAEKAGVTMLNIAVDEHGELSSIDRGARAVALANYARWIPIAAYLGIPAIRCNSGGQHAPNHKAAVECCIDSFRHLCEVGRQHGVKILIENHNGLSFDPAFIVELVRRVRLTQGEEAIAVLADFGNWPDTVDRYAALGDVLPYASAVHAKVNDIDADLNHPRFDLGQCVKLCRSAKYDGHLGIEYEGETADPIEGVKRGVRLLRKLLSDHA
ncbi:MAG: Xylose isomerase protein barrel [Phycisphaerales bacterium]|nr:Xylose isomerase protein barrel [Phycisphaerales bacterium]